MTPLWRNRPSRTAGGRQNSSWRRTGQHLVSWTYFYFLAWQSPYPGVPPEDTAPRANARTGTLPHGDLGAHDSPSGGPVNLLATKQLGDNTGTVAADVRNRESSTVCTYICSALQRKAERPCKDRPSIIKMTAHGAAGDRPSGTFRKRLSRQFRLLNHTGVYVF